VNDVSKGRSDDSDSFYDREDHSQTKKGLRPCQFEADILGNMWKNFWIGREENRTSRPVFLKDHGFIKGIERLNDSQNRSGIRGISAKEDGYPGR